MSNLHYFRRKYKNDYKKINQVKYNILSYDEILDYLHDNLNNKQLVGKGCKNQELYDNVDQIYMEAFHLACHNGTMDTVEKIYKYCILHDDDFDLCRYVTKNYERSVRHNNHPYITDFFLNRHVPILKWLKKKVAENKVTIDWTMVTCNGWDILDGVSQNGSFDMLKFIVNEYESQHKLKKYKTMPKIYLEDEFNILNRLIDNYRELRKNEHAKCVEWLYEKLLSKNIITGPLEAITFNVDFKINNKYDTWLYDKLLEEHKISGSIERSIYHVTPYK